MRARACSSSCACASRQTVRRWNMSSLLLCARLIWQAKNDFNAPAPTRMHGSERTQATCSGRPPKRASPHLTLAYSLRRLFALLRPASRPLERAAQPPPPRVPIYFRSAGSRESNGGIERQPDECLFVGSRIMVAGSRRLGS